MNHLTRRSFNSLAVALGVGLGIGPGMFSCGPVTTERPEADQVVPEIAAGYAVKIFTRANKIIDSAIHHVEPIWGCVGFRAVTNFNGCETVVSSACCVPIGEIVSRLPVTVVVCG